MKNKILQLVVTVGFVLLTVATTSIHAASVTTDKYYHRVSDFHQVQVGTIPKIMTLDNSGLSTIVEEPYAVHKFKVLSNPEVTVRSTNGSITIIKGSSDTVKVEVYIKRRGLAILTNDKLNDDFRLVIRQRQNRIFAEVINLKGAAWTSNMPVFDFVVEVPERASASLHTNFGDISVNGISGMVDAMTSQGVIHTSDTQGMFKLSTTAGEVIVESHKGEVFTNLLNGDVSYNDVQGESRIKVVSGNIVLKDMRGSILVNNTNGLVDLDVLMVNQLIDIQTVVGDVTVRLPRRGAFDLVSEGQLVQINNDSEVISTPGRDILNTKINQGGVPIHLKTRVGQIDIKLE